MLYSPIWEEYENVCSATMFIFAEMSLKSSEGNMPTLTPLIIVLHKLICS